MKKTPFIDDIGYFIPTESNEDNYHEFGIYQNGNRIETGFFPSIDVAREKAKPYYSGEYEIKDETIKEEMRIALTYRKEIKKVKRSFKSTNIIIDMCGFYGDRFGYRYIPFYYNGKKYAYREEASGKAWVDEINDGKKAVRAC